MVPQLCILASIPSAGKSDVLECVIANALIDLRMLRPQHPVAGSMISPSPVTGRKCASLNEAVSQSRVTNGKQRGYSLPTIFAPEESTDRYQA
jgi:hypothetical protein